MKSSQLFQSLLWAAVAPLLLVDQVLAKTYYVTQGQSIQAAIDGAAAGDRIQVGPGTYTETIQIQKDRIDLRGDRATLTPGPFKSTPCGGQQAICIAGRRQDDYVKDVSVTGFTIKDFATNQLSMIFAQNPDITKNNFVNFANAGIFSVFSNGGKIQANTFSGASYQTSFNGIFIINAEGPALKIAQNKITNARFGIFTSNSIADLENNDISQTCVAANLFSTLPGFMVSHNHIGPSLTIQDCGNAPVGINLSGAESFTIDHNTVENIDGVAIYIFGGPGAVMNNILRNNKDNIINNGGSTVTKNQCTNPSTNCNY